MNRLWTIGAIVAAAGILGADAAVGQLPEPDSQASTWQPPDPDQVRREVFAWLEARKPESGIRAKAEALWAAKDPEPGQIGLLRRVVETVALAHAGARKLLELCGRPGQQVAPPAQPWLVDPNTSPLVANNLRLWYGRWLVHQRLYDEAQEQLAGLEPADVVDPATLLFYQGIVHHRLLDRDAGLEVLGRLLENGQNGPRRYRALAQLMRSELEDLKEESLDHIARRMQDIERRLGLGRAGPKVRKIEDGVIESLDKLIKELEDRQQQQQASGGGSNVQPRRPASDSFPMGGKGTGQVTKRDVGERTGWGNLPPRQREEAMQQIGRQFPSHYRDVIEQYFRKLASEENR